jgi:hypothetical protein
MNNSKSNIVSHTRTGERKKRGERKVPPFKKRGERKVPPFGASRPLKACEVRVVPHAGYTNEQGQSKTIKTNEKIGSKSNKNKMNGQKNSGEKTRKNKRAFHC